MKTIKYTIISFIGSSIIFAQSAHLTPVDSASSGRIKITPHVMGGDGGGSVEDVNCPGKVVCPVGTIATFNTRLMNIPFQSATIQEGSIDWGIPLEAFAEPYFDQLSNYLNQFNQGTLYDRAIAVKNYSNYVQNLSDKAQSVETVYKAYAAMVGTVIYAVGHLLAQENIQWRGYFFHVPVSANYAITCDLKGGWDKPRNRVRLNGAGSIQIDYSEQLVSDRSTTWQVHLEPGPYYLSVGLGSGTSNVFHTAGSLNSVRLSEINPISFQTPMILASKTIDVDSLMPNAGNSSIITVRLPTASELNSIQFPDLMDGSKPTLSPVIALPIQVSPNIPLLYRQLLRTGTNYCFRFIYSNATELQTPTIDANGVHFYLNNIGLTALQECINP